MSKDKLLSVWNKEKLSGKRMNHLPMEVQRKLYGKAKRLRAKGLSYETIAKELGHFGQSTIWHWLNTDTRPYGTPKIISLQPRADLARFFGYLEGSSCIGKWDVRDESNRKYNLISIKRKDKEILEYIQETIEKIFHKKPSILFCPSEQVYDLNFRNKHLVEFWNGYEGMPDHYGRVEFKETIEKYPEHFLAGIFDTSGSINEHPPLSIVKDTTNEKSADLILDTLKSLGISCRKYYMKKRGQSNQFRVMIDKGGLRAFLDKIPLEIESRWHEVAENRVLGVNNFEQEN